MEDLVTVIIPAYNVEKYISRCIDSVLGQTYQSFEIIVIDDGSTDKTGEICDSFSEIDNRIYVYHQDNKGLSVARNVGLDNATGKWIYFLDSDDWIDNRLLEIMVSVGIENDASIVSCLSREFHENDNIFEIKKYNFEVETVDYKQIIRELRFQKKIRFEVWDKLWKRDLIGTIRFIDGQVSEDIHFDRLVLSKVDKIYCINLELHHYLCNRIGNTCSDFKKKRMSVFKEFYEWCVELEPDGELKQIMAIIAAKFAINMYEQAVDTKQSITIRKQIIKSFRYFDSLLDIKDKINEPAIMCFEISPYVFLTISKVRQKMKG